MRVCLCLCLCREYEIQELAIPGTCSVIQMHQEFVAHILWPTLKQETWVVSQIFRSWRGLFLRFSALAFPCAVVVSFRSFWQEGGGVELRSATSLRQILKQNLLQSLIHRLKQN